MKITKQEDGTYIIDGENHTIIFPKKDEQWLKLEGFILEEVFIQNFVTIYPTSNKDVIDYLPKFIQRILTKLYVKEKT